MADVSITLYVDTNQITVQTVDQYSNFGQGPGITNENYTTYANAGDTITWLGLSTSSTSDQVNVTNIIHSGNSNVFSQEDLPGNNLHPEKVIATVRGDAKGLTEKYTIQFTVYNNGVRKPGTFKIDPKLAINV